MMNDCDGCKYERSTDIETHLEFCTDCKRAYSSEEDRGLVKHHTMRFLTQLQEKELREYYSVTNKNITYKGDFK